MVEKLRREIDRYREAASNGWVLDMKDAAFNASVTAWHLVDWVYNDMTAEQRAAFKEHCKRDVAKLARERCRALHLCRQAATASKHWIVDELPDPSVDVIVTAAPTYPPGEPTIKLLTTETTGAWHILFVDGDKRIDAGQVFDEALHFWTEFAYSITDGRP